MANDKTAAVFAELEAHRKALAGDHVADYFARDARRFDGFHATLDDLLFDYSKHRITSQTLSLLFALARAAEVERKRDAMFAGAVVNPTEHRPALHTALRRLSNEPLVVDGRDVVADVHAERARVGRFAAQLRDGTMRGATGKPFAAVVNIGIGGSDLGPAMATRALAPFAKEGLRCFFVSNVDGADIGDTLRMVDPATTLFIVSSKTFTTQETMTNAASARAWLAAGLGEDAVPAHFAAVSTKLDLVKKFGIREDAVFGFWDWVGGRYSIWSSIGLALTIAIGPEQFREFLQGGNDVDRHFQETPLAQNIPALMGLIGVWYRNVWGFAAQAVIPYDQRLGRFPAYLQQLDMESDGKSVRLDGSPARGSTGPLVWGEPGTNGQHAFFQLLHQGTDVIPVDFLVAANPTRADTHHHELLFANCLAQSEALMRGRTLAEVEAQLKAQGKGAEEIAAVGPHKVFSGNRPSSSFVYRQLTPRTLGRLIALYEHKVFVQAAIWNTNPFDQWGVELGKELASRLAPIVAGEKSTEGLDASTAGLVAARKNLQGVERERDGRSTAQSVVTGSATDPHCDTIVREPLV